MRVFSMKKEEKEPHCLNSSEYVSHHFARLQLLALITTATLRSIRCECDKPGWFGEHCSSQCHCRNNTNCAANGDCLDQCAAGWFGPKCQYQCDDGQSGEKHCAGGHQNCDPVTGYCNHGCELGYKEPDCRDECDDGQYGKNCISLCAFHCAGGHQNCDPVTGHCKRGCVVGYKAPDCRDVCPPTFYGVDCRSRCSEDCVNRRCEPRRGKCLGCPPGRFGDMCDIICSIGQYGPDCLGVCSEFCLGGLETCDVLNGSCQYGCILGMEPPLCKVEVVTEGLKFRREIKKLFQPGIFLAASSAAVALSLISCIVDRYRLSRMQRDTRLRTVTADPPMYNMSDLERWYAENTSGDSGVAGNSSTRGKDTSSTLDYGLLRKMQSRSGMVLVGELQTVTEESVSCLSAASTATQTSLADGGRNKLAKESARR